ncbi:uncharacterized protein LOC131684723 [Topomyia yanbarensis]|uniref:uncharacterized protein LOC131684723 n=1 Tax=Topomyia yanbarensis TaxID=2498891 RepID=UPI00273B8A7E|nr:uncharacterized protein LOC131684723 [Topomyia yanbarensis]
MSILLIIFQQSFTTIYCDNPNFPLKVTMRSRSSGSVDCSPLTGNKHPYNRKPLLCRLCLRVLAKEDLLEIFTENNNLQKEIRAAVSVEVNRDDRSIRVCQSCLDLVYTINAFRTVCEKSAILLSQEVQIPSGTFWAEQSDQNVFTKCRTLVEHCKTEIENRFLEKLEICCDDTNDSFEESITFPVEFSPAVDVDIKSIKDDLPVKIEALNLDILSDVDDDDIGLVIDNTCSRKLEYESEIEFIGFSEQESEAENTDSDPDFVIKPKRSKQNSSNPPRRRGKPSLTDEMLKRRMRILGEQKRKPGPKTRVKPPAESECEIQECESRESRTTSK